MPHAVIQKATNMPDIGQAPVRKEGTVIHRVTEVAESERGWLLKCLIVDGETQTKFLARVDRREDGLLVHLDDHMDVERSPQVFSFLGALCRRVLDANPNAKLGKNNLVKQIEAAPSAS